jgi:hypothetical protein
MPISADEDRRQGSVVLGRSHIRKARANDAAMVSSQTFDLVVELADFTARSYGCKSAEPA